MRLFFPLFLFFVFLQVCKCQHAEYEICAKNLSLQVKVNEIIFFKSLNFPQLLTNEITVYLRYRLNCSMYLYLEENIGSKRGLLVFTNVIPTENYYPKFNVFEKTANVSFNDVFSRNDSYYPNSNFYFNAFQGFVLFDDPTEDDCPLESISKNEPYYFNNENEIISIQSSFDKSKRRKNACLWQFAAPKGYGFKIVFEELNIQYPIQLNVENSTQTIYTERNVKAYFPYYNSDNYLKISLSQNAQAYLNDNLELIAYISIIKNHWDITPEKCSFISVEKGLMIWKNKYNNMPGYHNNAMCEIEMEILSKTEMIVTRDMLYLEKNIDLITYAEDNETDSMTVFEDSMRLTGEKDGTSRNFTWQFLSDGSITSLGFQLSFKTIECKCKNPVIEICSDYIVLDSEKYAPHQPYCGGLNCNFTLKTTKSCPYSVFYVRFSSFLYSSHSDIYRIYSNNNLTFEINTKDKDPFDYYIFLSTNVENILEIRTDITTAFWYSKIIVTTVEQPNIWTKLILTEENPYAEFDTAFLKIPQLNTFLVQGSVKDEVRRNATIEIYSNARDVSMSFYSDETFEKNLNFRNCFIFDSKFEFQCKTTSSKLVIYPPPNSYKPFLFFQLSTAYPIGCVFKENVFNIAPSGITTISAMANEKGLCRIFILLEYKCQGLLEFLYTSARDENVKVYSGASNRKSFFEFSFETASQWKTVIWNTRIYTIDIPQSSSLLMKIRGYSCMTPWDLPTINVTSAPYKAVFSTSDYGIQNDICGTRFHLSKESFDLNNLPKDQGICVTILDFNVTDGDEINLYGIAADNKYLRRDKVEYVNQTFLYFNVTFEYYGPTQTCLQKQQKSLVYFEVKNINDCYYSSTQVSSNSPKSTAIMTLTPQKLNDVPICTAVTFAADFYNKTANKLIFTYSIDLNITKNDNDMLYSNDVTIGNFSYWSFDETLYYPRKNEWCIDNNECKEYILKRNYAQKYKFPNDLLQSKYFLKEENSYNDVAFSSILIDNGQIIDNHGKFFNPYTYSCDNIGSDLGGGIQNLKTKCCTNYVYIKIPTFQQFACNVFEVNTEIKKNNTIQASFNAVFYVTNEALYIHNNEFTSSVYKNYTFGQRMEYMNCKNNYNASNKQCWYPTWSSDEFYNIILSPQIPLTVTIAKFMRRNGILLKDDYTLFTSENPCWKQNLPIIYNYANLTMNTTFCCTSFFDVSTLSTTKSNFIPTQKSKTATNLISALSTIKYKAATDAPKSNTALPNCVRFFEVLFLILFCIICVYC